jgi:succinate dehydrogenase/fumarate reductase flavoprotein subunit
MDVLVVGGGIAGLMAAIRASELGAQVIVAEKGNTFFSGAGRAGNDHFWAYIPDYHGPDMDTFLKESMRTQLGYMLAGLRPSVVRTWLEHSFEMVKLWDKWGIGMKHDGKYHFQGHSFPGHVLTHLKYKGMNQKKVLTKQALKKGVKIINRIMIFDLLGGPKGACGAVGIDTREDRFISLKAKSVILGTGSVARLYPNITPALMANNTRPPTTCGDGRAMAYRIGAELINMEMINRHAGIKNYARAGQGSWMGVVRDPDGNPVGKYLKKPDRRYHDIIMEVDKQVFSRFAESGKGPLYMDCTGISDDDLEYLKKAMANEGNVGLMEHLKEENVDLKRNPVEFATYEIRSSGRIDANAKSETSVPGLYSIGDETTFSISGAAVFGWIGGENAASYSKGTPVKGWELLDDQIEEKREFVETLQKNDNGPDWYEANMALNHTLSDYAGPVRSKALLEAGHGHLKRLKEKLLQTATARDQWELTRLLEVVNLYDLGELVIFGGLKREESRGLHQRVDYPYTDPLLNGKMLVLRKESGGPVSEWRDVPA